MERELLELFDHLHEVIAWTKDRTHRFRWVNRPFLVNLGMRSRDRVLGRTDFDLYSPALANQYRFDDERVLKGERVVARIELVGRFDHSARWCATTKIPLRNRRGRIVGSVGLTYPLDGKSLLEKEQIPLGAAINFISEHCGESISNAQLAAACGLSVRAFERQFRAIYGTSPHVYLRQLRVRMSCSQLVYTKKSLAEIASVYGFSDQSHFTKEFRRFFGETPSAYRTRYRR
jgi:AraC-like DNA-binding protein